MQSSTPPTAPTSPSHPCVRCGAPVPLDIAMCERCNPLGLPQPASSQAHGTIFLAIVVSVVGLALLGRLALSGIGPFTGRVTGVIAASPGLAITLSVTNEGSSGGSTTCRVYDPIESESGAQSAYVQSPQIPPGATVAFSKQTGLLGSTVRQLAVECAGQ